MPQDFDAYRKWLGIPPKDQPPHHYRLLGIAVFESDPDVIENAADRQMSHVRNFQSGQYSQLSQQILNELAAAKICLLNADKRAEYDAQLRIELKKKKSAGKKQAGPASPPAVPPATGGPPALPMQAPAAQQATPQPMAAYQAPVPSAPPSAQPAPPQPAADAGMGVAPAAINTPSSSARSRSRRRVSNLPVVLGVLSALTILVLLIAVFSRSGKKDDPSGDTSRRVTNPTPRGKGKKQHKRPRQPKGKDGKRTKPKEKPSSLPDLTKLKGDPDARRDEFLKAVDKARLAMSQRDTAGIDAYVKRADEFEDKDKTDEAETVKELLAQQAFLTSFWENVRTKVQQLKPNQSFDYQGETFVLKELNGEKITYLVDDQEYTPDIRGLATGHAVAFALHDIDDKDAPARLQAAAFLSIDNFSIGDLGDRDKYLKEAQRLWREAADSGQQDLLLAKLLGIDLKNEKLPSLTPDPNAPNPNPLPGTTPNPNPLPGTDPTGVAKNGKRTPVPSDSALKKARDQLFQLYRSDIANAKSATEKINLAVQFDQQAKAKSDPNEQYVLWDWARQQYFLAQDVQAAFTIVDTMASQFDFDPMEDKYAALKRLSGMRRVDNDRLYQQSRDLLLTAEKEKDYLMAEKLGELAQQALNRSRKKDKDDDEKQLAEDLKRVKLVLRDQEAEKKADAARAALKDNADDPVANLTLGRHLCFAKDDWKAGLPHLAKGGDADECKLAAGEVKSPPTETDKQIELADQWRDLGRRRGGGTGDAMFRRAKHWLTQAAAELKDDALKQVQTKIAEIDKALGIDTGA